MPCSAPHQRPHAREARLFALCLLALAGLLATGCGAGLRSPPLPSHAVRIEIGARALSRPLPAGFVGLSIEYPSALSYFGPASDPNPVFPRLVASLAPDQAPVIRFGGDTTDWTWWPVPGMVRPKGIRYALGRRWLAATAAAARTLHARLILGVNLEADSARIAGTEARVLLRAIGSAHLAGFELGNEPEAYGTLGWYYRHHIIPVFGRPAGYGFAAYLRDYAVISRALPRRVALVGPASGAPPWLGGVTRFLAENPRVRTATFHRYPLHRCATARSSINYPTIAHLLLPGASSGPATSLRTAVAAVHAAGAGFRADELNSVSCGGARGVSDSFASALWVLDTLFNMVRVGVDGVNIHTFRSGRYAPFFFSHRGGHWSARVQPLYYGLLMFARAAPPGSRLLASRHRGGRGLRIWTTRGRDGRIRVLLINEALRRTVTTALRLPGAGADASVQRLTAPRIGSRRGVSLAGQSYAPPTTTGTLRGAPNYTVVREDRGRYVVRVPPASAALITTGGG
jgi:hypothetical protein